MRQDDKPAPAAPREGRKPAWKTAPQPDPARLAREAEALRENLRRRNAQRRGRQESD
jgi:hypothetical protein